jgi:hypothetical protein
MNQELWEKFDKFRSSPVQGQEGLSDFLKTEGIRFAPSDLSTWGQIFGALFGRSSGMIHVPEWLSHSKFRTHPEKPLIYKTTLAIL